jgi:hypothetical protein
MTATVAVTTNTVTSLDNQTVPANSSFYYHLEFSGPVKQVQVQWNVTTSNLSNIQLYETLDFTWANFVGQIAGPGTPGGAGTDGSGKGEGLTFLTPHGSVLNFILQYNNIDPSDVMTVTSVSVLGIADGV